MFHYKNQLDNTKILNNCTFVKTSLMLMVIIYHSCVFWTSTWWDTPPVFKSPVLSYFATWLDSFHIYTFTLVSGYIFAYKRLNGGYKHYGLFLKNKLQRLLVPYFFVSLIWMIPISYLLFQLNCGQIIKKYFLGINPEQLWFLWMLFDVFVIIWPLWKKIFKSSIFCWGIAIAFYCIGVIGKKIFPNVFCIWTAFEFIPLFCIGIQLRLNEENLKKQFIFQIHWFIWLILDLIFFVMSVFLSRQSGIIIQVLRVGVFFILHIIGAIMAFIILQIWANSVQWKESKVIKLLSTYSMPMYLFHQQIIYFTIIYFDGRVNPFVHFMINFIIAIFSSFSISMFLMQWKVLRKLLGES